MSEPDASEGKPDFNSSASRATLDTRVNLTPVASQTFLVAVAVAFCICLMCSTALFLAGNGAAWVFVIIGAALIAAALWAWVRSQSDVDLQAAAPTMLSLPNGATVSTDSRTLRNDVAVTAMLRLFEANQRQPLPQADALFSGGEIVPNSTEEARGRTERINREVASQAQNFQVLVGEPWAGPTVLQHPSEEALPNDGIASSERVNAAS